MARKKKAAAQAAAAKGPGYINTDATPDPVAVAEVKAAGGKVSKAKKAAAPKKKRKASRKPKKVEKDDEGETEENDLDNEE